MRSRPIEGLSPEGLYRAGSDSFRNRDYAHARACLSRYVEQKPHDASALHLLARAGFHLEDDPEKVEGWLKRAVELDPSSESRYLETLGLLYLHRGRHAQAAEIFAFALSKDPGDDQRHTNALEYCLTLARQKQKGEPGAGDGGPPGFLASDMDRWHEHRGQAFFFIPSLVVHFFIALLVGFLFTHPMTLKNEEDFTYVDIGPQAEESQDSTATSQGEKATDETDQAPVSERQEAAPAEPKKVAGVATGRQSGLDTAAQARQGAVGSKAAQAVGQPPAPAEQVRTLAAEKGADMKGATRTARADEAVIPRRSLGGMATGGGKPAVRETASGGLAERSPVTSPAGRDGIFLGDMKSGKGAGSTKSRAKNMDAGVEEAKGASTGAREKGLDVTRPGRRMAGELSPSEPKAAASLQGLGAGRPSPSGTPGIKGSGAPKAMDRMQTPSALPGGGAVGAGVPGETGTGTGKVKATLGVPDTLEAKVPVPGAGGGDRAAALPGGPPGRRFAALDKSPSKRELGIQTPGTGAGKGAGGRGREAPASLDRSAAGAATGGAMPQAGYGQGAIGAGAGSKAINKGLGGGSGKEEDGLLKKAGEKISDLFGMGGKARPSGSKVEADVRRGGKLPGMAPKAEATRSAALPTGAAASVKAGGVERSGTVAAGGAAAAGKAFAAGGQAAVSGGKRAADGALGTPGGEGEQRYASATGASTRPMQGEKQPGGTGGGRRAKNNTPGPKVNITSPGPGETRLIAQEVRGTISDQKVRKAILTVNGESKVISVENGAFEAVVAIREGRSTVSITAFDADGNVGKDSVSLEYKDPGMADPVNIMAPKDGQVFDVSDANTMTVRGSVPDREVKRAKLILNGSPMNVVVSRGYFEQKVALLSEQVSFMVEAVLTSGAISKSGLVTVNTVNVKPRDIMVILSWDKPHADMDLHIFGPTGGHNYFKAADQYASKDAIAGGQIEQDAKSNFGPEIFTQGHADKGVYTIKSNYYYSGGDGNSRSTVTVVLYGDNPSRRIVRVFGPHMQADTKTGEDMWLVTKLKMPEGIFLEE